MIEEYVVSKASGTVFPRNGKNPRNLYRHQRDALKNLDIINENDSYSTLVVLPTGGGKTYTASLWLLNHALDEGKKILWLAHRQMLLDQAAESFQKYAYQSSLPHIPSFTFRIISGAATHDRVADIKPGDNLLIVSKDSIGRRLSALDQWLAGEDEIFLVIDEAHHAPAKTYRKVIDYVKKKVAHVRLIGLTATPFRTGEDEKGFLGLIFSDGVKNGHSVKGGVGIAYQTSLTDLIKQRILARPIFESYYTGEAYGEELGINAWESIEHLDTLPDDIAQEIATSAARNKLIVDTYLAKRDEYGQTIVFAVSQNHCFALSKLFNDAGVKADFVVSDVRTDVGIRYGSKYNQKKIEAFRNGELQVLVNVNILTEGVDLPQTKTVFLARPTVSTILMTQMIGRALRGEEAGGTPIAYIVPFIDDWKDHVAWVSPESLFMDRNTEIPDNNTEYKKRIIRLIAIKKIEEFASVINETIDTSALEKVDFEKRIPIGMYAFKYTEKDDGMDISWQVMVYDSTKEAYEQLMDALPALFGSFGVMEEEYLDEETLLKMEKQCRETFFVGDMIPAYQPRDVIHILKYFAQNGSYDLRSTPQFYTFEAIDRERLDAQEIAKHIKDEDMRESEKRQYLNELWDNGDDNLLSIFYGRKLYFMRSVQNELDKYDYGVDELYPDKGVVYGKKKLEDLPLYEIGQYDPASEKQLRDGAFKKAMTKDGYYKCGDCGLKSKSRVLFQVDHILPMNRGGKTTPENLQILCRSCNGKKGDN